MVEMAASYFGYRCFLILLAFRRLLLEVYYLTRLLVFFRAATRAQIVGEAKLV
jgi:hypothetical protein